MGRVFGVWCDGDGGQHHRGVEGGDLVIQARQKFAIDELFGPAIDAGEVERRAHDAAEIEGRGHEGCPLSAAPWAGRRIEVWQPGNAGVANRGSRRRDCAM